MSQVQQLRLFHRLSIIASISRMRDRRQLGLNKSTIDCLINGRKATRSQRPPSASESGPGGQTISSGKSRGYPRISEYSPGDDITCDFVKIIRRPIIRTHEHWLMLAHTYYIRTHGHSHRKVAAYNYIPER